MGADDAGGRLIFKPMLFTVGAGAFGQAASGSGGDGRGFRLERDSVGIAPETLEVVVFAEFVVHHVDEDVEIIEHDPRGHPGALGGEGTDALILLQTLGDLIDDGTQMRFVGTGNDDEVVGHRGEFPEIQQGDVLSFFVVGKLGACECELFGFHRRGVAEPSAWPRAACGPRLNHGRCL